MTVATVLADRRAYVDGVRDTVDALRKANREAADAIASAAHGPLATFVDHVGQRSHAGIGMGRVEQRNLRDAYPQTMTGARDRVILTAVFGSGRERFTGGATTADLVRPYEFGNAAGRITVHARTSKGRGYTYTRRFPRNSNPDGRLVYPLAKLFARDLVDVIVTEVYALYRIALGDVGFIRTGVRSG